jgi:hypothetical protein
LCLLCFRLEFDLERLGDLWCFYLDLDIDLESYDLDLDRDLECDFFECLFDDYFLSFLYFLSFISFLCIDSLELLEAQIKFLSNNQDIITFMVHLFNSII